MASYSMERNTCSTVFEGEVKLPGGKYIYSKFSPCWVVDKYGTHFQTRPKKFRSDSMCKSFFKKKSMKKSLNFGKLRNFKKTTQIIGVLCTAIIFSGVPPLPCESDLKYLAF
jgi:hypothetical protein